MSSPPRIWSPEHDRQLMARACKMAATKVLGAEEEQGPEPLTEYVNDPNRYFVDILNRRPWKGEDGVPGQMEFNQSVAEHSHNCVFAGTGVGKTWDVAGLVHWFMMTRRNAIVITIATTWSQVVNQIWREIRVAHVAAQRNAQVPGRCLQTRLEISEKWFGMGLSPREPESLAGYHAQIEIAEEVKALKARWLEMTNDEYFAGSEDVEGAPSVMLVVDEASGVPDEFHDAGEGILTNPDSRCIKTGNLTRASGRFHKHYQDNTPTTPNRICYPEEESKADRKKRLAVARRQTAEMRKVAKAGERAKAKAGERPQPVWKTFRWTAFDAPSAIVSRDFIDRMRAECGPNYEKNPRYMCRVLALPPEGSAMAVFPQPLLEDCADIRPKTGGLHMSVDLGYGGGDPCVAQLWKNCRLVSTFRWQVEGAILDLTDSARVIATLARGAPGTKDKGWGVKASHIHVDASDSGGKGVVGLLLRNHRMRVDPVNFGGGVVGDWNYILGRPPGKLLNRKQELGWVALRLLQDGKLAIPDTEDFGPVIAQLSAIHHHDATDEGFRMEKKPKTIARFGCSPDDADCVFLALSRVDPASLRIRTVKQRRGPRAARASR